MIGVKIDELLEKIDSILERKLLSFTSTSVKEPLTKYLSREEVSKLLKITLPTLHDWTKIGLLKSYKIGNRVLYKEKEVEDSLLQVSTSKYKRITHG